MLIEQKIWKSGHGWKTLTPNSSDSFAPQLIFAFASREQLLDEASVSEIRMQYSNSAIIGCSTSGEIAGCSVYDNSIILTAIQFEKTTIALASIEVEDSNKSNAVAKSLLEQLPAAGLKHVFVLSDGLNVNGTELVKGFREVLPNGVQVTGGLAGDASLFQKTVVINSNESKSNLITAIGFYGNNIQIGYGSFGGWDSFGVERLVTKSVGNVLFEIDGSPALSLYKSFLGDQAKDLPGSGLLFPLSLRTDVDEAAVVRTILAVNEEDQSITFAGDVPEGSYVRLMKANIDRLIEGAVKAAKNINSDFIDSTPELAILISCVGRRLVLKQLVEEEIEGVQQILGKEAVLTGFYSYGEISPFSESSKCELHNQTMTITTFKEI